MAFLPITNFKNFLRDAGLTREGGLGGWGLRRNFPIYFRFFGTDMTGDALLSVRLAQGTGTQPLASFGPPLAELLAAGKAQADQAGEMATLLLRRPKGLFSDGQVLPVVDAFLTGLEASGLRPQCTCGVCGSGENLTLLSNGAQAGFVCRQCIGQQAASYQDRHGFAPQSVPKLVALAILVLVSVAVDWAAVSILIDKGFEAAGGSIKTSGKLMVLIAMLLGAGIGLPGLLFRLVPRRGWWWPVLLALGASLLGVGLGEILHADWSLWKQTGRIVLLPAWEFLQRFAAGGNDFLVFLRALMAATAVLAACSLARPPKAPLQLQ